MKILKESLSWLVPIFIGLIAAFALESFVLVPKRVDGSSMEPNLINNERIWVFRHDKIKHLSVIVFDAHGEDPEATPGTDYVKRVIGLPDDRVAFRNNALFVNGKKINQNFISKHQAASGTGSANWTLASLAKQYGWGKHVTVVPNGKYFVLGDHRSVSNDSRYWGFVDKNKVTGVVKVAGWTGTKTQRHNINNLGY